MKVSHTRILFVSVLFFYGISSFISSSLWPDDQDGVNYLFGVDQYDLGLHHPHFPGYPLYIAAGKLISAMTGSAENACVLLSVFSALFCLCLVYLLLEKEYNHRTAFLSSISLAVLPVFFEFSHKIYTEIPALALLLSAVTVVFPPSQETSKRWFFSGVLFGLLLGVRLSWFPFPLYYCIAGWKKDNGISVLSGLAIGALFWFIPQLAVVGTHDFFSIGVSFTLGHFTDWGGVVGTSVNFWGMLSAFFLRGGEIAGWFGPGPVLIRLPWIILTIYSIICMAGRVVTKKSIPEKGRVFFYATICYFTWVALGQNTQKVRHFLPLIPWVVVVSSPFVYRHPKLSSFAICSLVFFLLSNYIPRVISTPPAVRLQEWAEALDSNDVAFYCGESERFFDRYPMRHRMINVKRIEDLDRSYKAIWPKPSIVYVCDDIKGFTREGEPVVVFKARDGDPVDRPLSLYRG